MCQNFIPGPAYKVGDRIQTRWITDDTKELCIETGLIYAMTYTTDKRHPALDVGWNYHVFFDDSDRGNPGNEVHESQIILVEEVQVSE